jgi:hypothetical protein
MTGHADRWIRWTTTGCVALLALIAGTVSYLHMHTLVAMHGQPGWVAALTPLSVDGMIVAASTTLLAESRSASRGGVLPWSLLAVGSVASLAANVAVAEPTLIGRVIAAWPSFALTASYELLTRQVRRNAAPDGRENKETVPPSSSPQAHAGPATERRLALVQTVSPSEGVDRSVGRDLQRQAWQWALANRASDGTLPSGGAIARQYGRHERWGRLVKRSGIAGEFAPDEVAAP